MPSDTNFNYYSTKYYLTITRKLAIVLLDMDNFVYMIGKLHHPFSIIGIAETKMDISINLVTNTELPGYQFLS